MKSNDHDIEITDREKVLFPEGGFTKGDVIDYYQDYASAMLPYLAKRPISMVCAPEGTSQETFYRKKVPSHFPDWITTTSVPLRSGGSNQQVIVDTPETLVFLADQACFSLHPWLARATAIDTPDRIVFDLDVESKQNFSSVIEVARLLRDHLPVSYIMLTGGTGVHVVMPLKPKHDFDTVRKRVKQFCDSIASAHPKIVTTELQKKKRGGRIFLDYLRNSYGQTTVAPYTVRSKSTGSIATPVEWNELGHIQSADAYTLANIRRRLAQKNDPWKDMQKKAVSIDTLDT